MVNLASVDRCNLESKEYTILYLWVRRNRIVKKDKFSNICIVIDIDFGSESPLSVMS